MVSTYHNGHLIIWQDNKWYYKDGETVNKNNARPCPRCSCFPDKNGHDACLGTLHDVKYACCGHGVEKGYIIFNKIKELK